MVKYRGFVTTKAHCGSSLDLKWLQKCVLTQPLVQDYTLREYISCGSWHVS
jgi:hypothetical protein